MTARDLVARMLARAAADGTSPPSPSSYRDAFKIGDPNTEITGVATTGMTTFAVLKRAVAERRNLLIPHEPTWFNDRDEPTGYVDTDPVYLAKRSYCEDNGLVIWRDHDLAHRIRPDQMFAGLLRQLGWSATETIGRFPVVALPRPTPFAALAGYVVGRLGVRAYRLAGPPDMIARKVAIGVGYAFPSFLDLPDVDILIGGEAQEGTDSDLPTYDLTQFAADATALGRPRGLVLLVHMGTEDVGMKLVADWIGEIAPELSVAYLPAGEPFAEPF